MAGGFSIRVTRAELGLQALAGDVEQLARPVAQAGAQVLYEEVQRNVARRTKRRTGNLASAVYQAYSERNSGPARAEYHVSWNASKASHGHLVEFGHLQRYEVSFDRGTGRFITHKDRPLPEPRLVAARPFVRPAMSAAPRAQQAMVDRFWAELQARGWVGSAGA